MKIYNLIAIVTFLISGCSTTPYKGPASGPTATLQIQETRGNVRFAGKLYSPVPSNIALFDLDNQGCVTGMNSGKPIGKDIISRNGLVKVPVNKLMAIMMDFSDNRSSCSTMQAIQFEAKSDYAIQPIYPKQEPFQRAKCSFAILKNGTPVPTKKVESHGLTSACIKH